MSTTDLWLHNRKRFLLIATATFRRINIRYVQSRSNKNALTTAFSLACLEVRSRNEEAINSTRNRIYSLRFFTSFVIIVDTLVFKYLLNLCVSKLEVFTQLPPAYHENSGNSMVSCRDSL